MPIIDNNESCLSSTIWYLFILLASLDQIYAHINQIIAVLRKHCPYLFDWYKFEIDYALRYTEPIENRLKVLNQIAEIIYFLIVRACMYI